MYTIKFKRSLLYSALLATMLIAGVAYAANWLMLQGTESTSSAGRAKLWGVVQMQYQHDFSDPYVTGSGAELYNSAKLISPNLNDQSGFNIYRARIGVRGANPLDGNTNYFFQAEFGNNGITHGNGAAARITDASITLNHIPHARIRLGLFKTPGADEGMEGIYLDYINFTSITKQLMLERFPDVNDSNKAPSATPGADLNQYSNPVGAFRDVGIQLFDMFKKDDWEHTYAVMIGNGNGLKFSDNDSNKDVYAYWSSEKVFCGKGRRRSGWKTFAWLQEGKRTNVYNTSETQSRQRYGIGTKYLQKPFRVTAEYMQGKGMIFQGPNRPGHIFNDLKASGWYVEGGWYIPNTNFEIDLRFDSYTREENHPTSVSGDDSRFNTWTIGAQYHFNKKTRIGIEYAIRDAKSDTAAVNNHLYGVGGRLALQVTAIY